MTREEAKCIGLGLANLIGGLVFKYKFEEPMFIWLPLILLGVWFLSLPIVAYFKFK